MSSLLNGANPKSIDGEKLPGPTSFGNTSSSIIKPTVAAPEPSPSLLTSEASQSSATPTPGFIAQDIPGPQDIPGQSSSAPATSSTPSGFTAKDVNQSTSAPVASPTPSTTTPELATTSNPSPVPSTSVVPAISPTTSSIIPITSASSLPPAPTSSSAVAPIAIPPSQNPPDIRPAQPQDQNPPAPDSFTEKDVPSPQPSPAPAPSPAPSPNLSPAPSPSPSPTGKAAQGGQAFSAAAVDPPAEPSKAPPSQPSPQAAGGGAPAGGVAPAANQPSSAAVQPTSAPNPPPGAAAALPPAATSNAANTPIPDAIVPDAVVTAIPAASDPAGSASGIITTIGLGGANDQSNGRQSGDSGNGGGHSGAGAPSVSVSSGSKPPMGTIVGGTIGGIAAVSLLIVLFWFWRKKAMANRRRMPLTPTEEGPSMEKRFGGDSGPTARGVGLGGMMGFVGKTFGKGSKSTPEDGARNVDMNRGNSQFLEAVTVDTSSNGNPAHRRISSDRNGPEDFRVGLGLSFVNVGDFNPFSDANAVSSGGNNTGARRGSRIPLSNPFADSNMILPPPASARTTSERRSRGRSFGGLRSFQGPAVTPRPHSVHRESLVSTSSFEERRNKFRSDPFDLELESRLIPTEDNIAEMPQRTEARRVSSQYSAQSGQHVRVDSYTSKYASGASLGEWGDPGPDIGSAMAGRDDSPTIRNDELRQFGERARRQGEGNPFNAVVGQAL